MKRRALLHLVSALAVGLVVLGLSWNALFPPQSYWSPQKAQDYQDAFQAAHTAQDAFEHGETNAGGAELAAAHERYERLQVELSQAQTARSRTGKLLVVVGLLLLLTTVLLRQFSAPNADQISR